MTVPIVRFTVAGENEEASAGLGRAYTVVYDGDCRVCTRLAGILETWDASRQLEVVSSQHRGVMARFPWIPARAYVEALQLIARDGTTWQGSPQSSSYSASCPADAGSHGCSASPTCDRLPTDSTAGSRAIATDSVAARTVRRVRWT